MTEIGTQNDIQEYAEYLQALESGYTQQLRPEGRGHMRWALDAAQDLLAVRRKQKAMEDTK